MTLTQIETRLLERVGGSDGSFYSAAETREAVNAAQRLFVLLSMCLEKTGTLALTAGQVEARLLTTFTDYIAPVRIRTPEGYDVRPGSVAQFRAANDYWRSETGDRPERFAVAGFDFAMFYPAPAAGVSLTVTYACGPVEMVSNSNVPEIPEEYHQALIDGAEPILRCKEGGQEFAKSLPKWKAFLAAARECAEAVKQRNKAADLKIPALSMDFSRYLDAGKS